MSHRLVDTQRRLPLAGCLLVATLQHPNPQFSKSVFLITWHRAEASPALANGFASPDAAGPDFSSIGVLLNRSLVADVRELWSQVLGSEAQPMPGNPGSSGNSGCSGSPVLYGGPLAGPVIALHNKPELAEAEAAPGVYVAAQVATLRKLGASQGVDCRWMVGHTAWPHGELEKQIEAGWWYPIPATPDLVFSAMDEIWYRGVRRAGDLSLALLTGCPPVPNSGVWN